MAEKNSDQGGVWSLVAQSVEQCWSIMMVVGSNPTLVRVFPYPCRSRTSICCSSELNQETASFCIWWTKKPFLSKVKFLSLGVVIFVFFLFKLSPSVSSLWKVRYISQTDYESTYVQVCMQMRKLRFLRKIAKIVNCAKKKTNPQLGLAILAKIAIFAIFRKNR